MRGHALERLAAWDRLLCRRFNRASHFAAVRLLLVTVSRLGNGIFWYCLMAALLTFGPPGAVSVVARMFGAGVVCTVLYKWIKRSTSRPRPYAAQPEIMLHAAPLDQFSFPSGHTLHATALSLIVVSYYPSLVWLLAPFAALVALSRVVLGLHYPSDVLAGALLGAMIAGVFVSI